MPRKTTEQFVAEAKAIHDSAYEYSNANYIRSNEKLNVTCPFHGDFALTPSNHLKGRGCPTCAKIRRAESRTTTLAEFQRKARQKHKGVYQYGQVRFNKLSDRVRIICPEHGPFWQAASQHLSGRGCWKCGRVQAAKNKTFSRDQFVRKAKHRHGDLYDYSRVSYSSMHEKVLIICTRHGPFKQKAANHLQGNGCPKCRSEGNRERFALSQSEFLRRFYALYGDSLSPVDLAYINAYKKVRISCPGHGEFLQYPVHLLRGVGCPTCGKERTAEKLRMSVDDFIVRAKEKHRMFYAYENVAFENLREKILITCPTHGEFSQVAHAHLAGAGCPICRASKGELAIANWLEQNGIAFVHQWAEHDCVVNVNRAKWDFFVPEHDLLIEFDGEHHSSPVRFGSSICEHEALERLKRQIEADRNKDRWADKNGYFVLRIKYDQDVNARLEGFFRKISED